MQVYAATTTHDGADVVETTDNNIEWDILEVIMASAQLKLKAKTEITTFLSSASLI